MRSYQKDVEPYLNNFIEIKVPNKKIIKIKSFAKEVVQQKKQEAHHKIDGGNEYKRFYTGTLGEAAIEELFGIDIIDWSIGNSDAYNSADLRSIGLNVGIKTVEYGKYPVVHMNPKRPELILIKKNDDTVYVCGLALKKVMLKYRDIDLILSPSLKARGTKTGFYGFGSLIRIENIGVLRVCINKKVRRKR